MSREPVSGWYPDDSGNMRYWDGQAWTSHTSTPEALDAAMRAAAPRQVPDRLGTANNPVLTTPVKKKTWPWVVGGVMAFIVVISIFSGGEDDSQATANTPQPTSTVTVTETATADPEPQATETVTEKATPKPKPPPAPTPTPTPEPAPEAGAIAVNAAQIVKEFENNEFKADTKYKGKTLRITGVVDKIDTDFWDDSKYILSLGDGGDWVFLTVDCYGMSNEELSTLDKGDIVTVIGEFDDGGDLGVDVKHCALA